MRKQVSLKWLKKCPLQQKKLSLIHIFRDKRRPEPYKGKGIKYADEVIRRKVGKTGKK